MCICEQVSETKVRLLLHWTLLDSTVSEEVTKCLRWRCLFLIWPVIPIPVRSHFWFIKTISLWVLNYEILKLLKDLELRDLPTLWNLLTKGHISLTIQPEAGHPWCEWIWIYYLLDNGSQLFSVRHQSTRSGQWATLMEVQFSFALKCNSLNF